METIKNKAAVFFAQLCNTYKEEEDRDEMPRLTLDTDGDITSDLTAMLLAMNIIFERLCPDMAKDMDMIDFTHMLNRLAIQFCYNKEGAEDGDAEKVSD